MDNFLSEQKSGGADISDGSFTLNRERALEIAKTLQLPERRAYILKLVQWAVASNATHIKVETAKGGLVFKHNGHSPSEEEFANLKLGVVDFAHLSSGIFGALGLEPSELTLSWGGRGFDFVSGELAKSDDQAGWVEIRIEGIKKGLFERSPMVSSFLRRNWLRVSVDGALQRLILDATGIANIEAALVRSFCGFCSVPLELNGKFVNSAFEAVSGSYLVSWEERVLKLKSKPSKLACAIFFNFCFSDKPGEILAPLTPVSGNRLEKIKNQWFQYPSLEPVEPETLIEGGFVAPVTLDDEPMYRAKGFYRPVAALRAVNVSLVKDGVLVDEFQETGNGLGGSAFFSAGGLKVSADGFRIVRDEAFEDYRSNLRAFFLANKVNDKDYKRLLGS